MTQKDKQLLLQDLCARLPYGAKVKCPFDDELYTLLSINWNKEIVVIGFMMDGMYVTSKQKLVDIKPYLRPMSSMTEKEMTEYKKLSVLQPTNNGYDWHEVATIDALDWLLANHLDFMGLIDEGLAIDCTNLNVY